jgi:hypothetical protein
MVDLRETVKEDRGMLKKIELAIPGFRGYRKREDLRIADSLLRTQLADRIQNVVRDMEQCRENLTKKMELDILEDTGNLIARIIALEGKVRHAEQGYTGISTDYRIEEDAQNRLYEWDLRLIGHIDDLKKSVSLFQSAINSGSMDTMRQEMSNISVKLRDFTELFEKRRDAIAGLGIE